MTDQRQGDWLPTVDLRFAVPDHTTTEPPVLQQRWIISLVNSFGHLSGYDEEWRAVERVVVAK